MANLSIAKATFLASCLRPDVTKLTRDDLEEFHTLLDTAIARCTPKCFQNFNPWIVTHVAPSLSRITAFGKYLKSFSKYLDSNRVAESRWKGRRQQLHILYALNDILHHLEHHVSDTSLFKHFATGTASIVPELFANAAQEKKARVLRRLNDLAQIWTETAYYDEQTMAQIRQCISSGQSVTRADNNILKPVPESKEMPWLMPATHGDVDTLCYDLPAANMMPHIHPNSSRPIRPASVSALQLSSGPADQTLVNAVKDFLEDVKTIEDPYSKFDENGTTIHMDDLGQLSHRNEAGDNMGDTYYGWSKAFCEKMKARTKEVDCERRPRSYSGTRSRSLSRSVSRSSRKRRRHESSISRSRSSSRERRRAVSVERPSRGLGMLRGPPAQQARSAFPAPPAPPPPPAPSEPFPNMLGFPMIPPIPGGTMNVPPRPTNWQGPWPPPPPPPPGVAGFIPPPPPSQNFNVHNYSRR